MSGTNAVAANTPNSGGAAGNQLLQQRDMARNAILAVAQNMVQTIQSATIANPGNQNNNITVNLRPIGLLKRLWVECTATVQNNDATNDISLTPWGPAQLISNFTFNDLSNNVRINDAGWHLHQVATAKRSRPYGSAYLTDSPVQYGNNNAVISAPTTIAKGGGTGTIKMLYEVPITYSDVDFRGGIWLSVTGNTATLNMTVNPNPSALNFAQGGDPWASMYQGSTNAAITSITYTVVQNYLDQLPRDNTGNVVLPVLDISTVYLLNQVVPPLAISAGQDVPVPYSNFRDFMSTTVIFDNGGALNTGSDVNYWALQTANFVDMINVDPNMLALWSRNMLMDDMPPGSYYFSHRHRPINVRQFGNQYLVLNAKTVNANAKLIVGYEMFAQANLVAQAGALTLG